MDEKKIYQTAPKHYLLCYNASCELATSCLHHLAAQAECSREEIVECVNPAVNGGKQCAYYRKNASMRMAYGMMHSFDKVLARDITGIRRTLVRHFGNGSYYLRRNGKQAITQAEQEYISGVFRNYGYADGAIFDSYQDELNW